jgi:hypothetical protein
MLDFPKVEKLLKKNKSSKKMMGSVKKLDNKKINKKK